MDKNTQAQLTRGERMVEILKQGQYVPMSVENQVAVIFAASKGYLDQIPVEKIVEFESKLFDYLEANNRDDLKSLANEGVISDDMSERVEKSISDFTKGFTV